MELSAHPRPNRKSTISMAEASHQTSLPSQQLSLYWHYDAYVSFRHTALNYIQALHNSGHTLRYEPYESDIVIIQGSVETIGHCYRTYPELRNRYVIGFVQWETDELPGWMVNILRTVDEIWTSSDFCASVFRKHHKNVHVIPHIVHPPLDPAPPLHWLLSELSQKKSSNPFFFYTIINKIEPRKNIEGIVEAFTEADLGKDCFLIIKTGVQQMLPPRLRFPQVIHLAEWQTEKELSALHSGSHVYISAHRGEGWGLGMSEAMAHENITIATNYGGNTYYMNSQNSLLVDYELRAIKSAEIAAHPHLWTQEMKWAEIKKDRLIETLKLAYHQYADLINLRKQASIDMRKFAAEPIAQLMQDRLFKIAQDLMH